jgi:hypothetical protein
MFNDKNGGSLPTLNNAGEGVFPNDKYSENYSGFNPDQYNRGNYDDKNLRGPIWRDLNTRFDNGEIVRDAYSRNPLEKGKVDMDHIVSAKEHSKDAALHLWFSEDERKKIVNDPSNLAATSAGINRSKQDKSVDEYIANGKHNPNADPEMMVEHDSNARDQILKTKAAKVAAEASFTIGQEALKLGLRQGIGIVLRATSQATFVEAKDIYCSGFSPNSVDSVEALKVRANRIKTSALESVPMALSGAQRGVVGGVISELLTWLINSVMTTAKNLVRIIREGVLKFVEAINLIRTRPAEMTMEEAIREALKIVGGVLGLALGIAAEESLKTLLLSMPLVNAFAAEIAAVMAAILAGVTMGVVVYLIDAVFDKLSMPFETQSLDRLAQDGVLQHELFSGVAQVSEIYAGVVEKLSQIRGNYDVALADGDAIGRNYAAMIDEGRLTDARLSGETK